MKSETLTVRQLFQDRRQYCVPFYQRAYVWTRRNQWDSLWHDIEEKAEARRQKAKPLTPHFLGAVVLEPQPKETLIGVDTLHIIDGQQRLTTLQYIMAALLIVIRQGRIPGYDATITTCFTNGNHDTMRDPEVERFKVWPTFRDRDDFRAAMDAKDFDALRIQFPDHCTQQRELKKFGSHPPAMAAIWFFAKQFGAWIESGDVATNIDALVMAVMSDLKLVTITLEQEDDAQVIFETLNGRGAELHATDLIRNYVFMRADREDTDAQALYTKSWAPFETPYWSAEQRRGRINKPRLEWLIHATLQAELGRDVELSRLYHEYRNFVSTSIPPMTAAEQLNTLTAYANHYADLTNTSGSTPIARFGKGIQAYEVTTIYPLALRIAIAPLSDDEKSEIYDCLTSYVVRRAVCMLTPKNYNNVFSSILRHLSKVGVSPKAVKVHLSTLEGDASRWPNDAEFRNACTSAPLYYGRLDAPKMRALLTEIEASLRRSTKTEEPVLPDLSKLDVDHIMPRAWHTHWPLADGTAVTQAHESEVEGMVRAGLPLTPRQSDIARRRSLIPTLGNLTLLNLSVNRSAQNEGFENKKNLLKDHTTLRLNVPLISNAAWNEDAIEARSGMMTDEALDLWKGPFDASELAAITLEAEIAEQASAAAVLPA